MPAVGQREKQAQRRIVTLFRERLGYDYLGDWTEREGFEGRDNRNVEPEYLRAWMSQRGVDDALVNRALYEFEKVAGDTGLDRSLRSQRGGVRSCSFAAAAA